MIRFVEIPPFGEIIIGDIVTFSPEEIYLAYEEVKFEFARQERFIYLFFDQILQKGCESEESIKQKVPFILKVLHAYKVDLFAFPNGQKESFAHFLIADYLVNLSNATKLDDIAKNMDFYILKAKNAGYTRNKAVSLFSKVTHFVKPHLIPIYDSIVKKQIYYKYASELGRGIFLHFVMMLKTKVALSDIVINEYFVEFKKFVEQSESFDKFSNSFKSNLRDFFKIRFIDKLLWSKNKHCLKIPGRNELTNSLNVATFSDNVRIMDVFWKKNQGNWLLSKDQKKLIRSQRNDTLSLQTTYPF